MIQLLLKGTACNNDDKVAASTASHADYSLVATTKCYFGKVFYDLRYISLWLHFGKLLLAQ